MTFPERVGPISRRRVFYIFTLAGIGASIALHFYFVQAWPHYVKSISSEHLRQTGGKIPSPSTLSTILSAVHGALALFLAGAAVPWTTRNYWSAGLWFACSIGITHLAFWLLTEGMSNLWPFSVLIILVMTAVPSLAGTAVMALVRSAYERRQKS